MSLPPITAPSWSAHRTLPSLRHPSMVAVAVVVAGALAAVAAAIVLQRPDPSGQLLWSGDFEAERPWQERFGVVHVREEPVTAPEVVPAPGRAGDALRIRFGDGGSRWGMDVRLGFAEMDLSPMDEAFLSYDVYFEDGFEFVGDGKMGGLAGTTGDLRPYEASSGGEFDERSFSARAMWQEDRGVTMYLYAHHAAGRSIADPFHGGYGIHTRFQKADGAEAGVLRTGTWHRIQHHVKLNTPGQDDGVYELWIDGHRGISVRDVQYRDEAHPDLRINQVMAAFFFGGGSDEYPSRTSELYLDDWEVSAAPPPA